MASETVANDSTSVLPQEIRPCVDHLVTEDDTPVDNIFSEKQQRLLTEPLYSSWARQGTGRKIVALANVAVFFAVQRPPYVPDMLLSLDVELPADLHPKAHRSYFVWLYGKPPDVVVELVSNKEGAENTEKMVGYARIGVKYYVIYDPDLLLSDQPLRVFQLRALSYQAMSEPIWLPGVELGLRLWRGRYEDHENTWLRWVDSSGALLLSGAERAEQERQRAELEHRRADEEQRRADEEHHRAEQLAEQVRRLGAEPEA